VILSAWQSSKAATSASTPATAAPRAVAQHPGQRIGDCPDFTYVSTWAGFVYVAFVIDAYARRIVGGRVSRTAHASFVLDALSRPFMNGGRRDAAVLSTIPTGFSIRRHSIHRAACRGRYRAFRRQRRRQIQMSGRF
jgi:transposase InsO family protein